MAKATAKKAVPKKKATPKAAATAEVVVMPDAMDVCGVSLFGCGLIHVKLVEILEDMFSREKEMQLRALFFSDTGPIGLYGEYLPDIKVAAINVDYCLHQAIVKVMQNENLKLNVLSTAWTNIIWAIAHELFHDIAYAVDPAAAGSTNMESEAHEYAEGMVITLAKEGDIEHPPAEEMGWLYERTMAHLVTIMATNEDFVKHQQAMIKGGLMFQGDNAECKTMKEYFALTDESRWDNATLVRSAPVVEERPAEEPGTAPTPIQGMDGSVMDMMDQFEDDGQVPWDEGATSKPIFQDATSKTNFSPSPSENNFSPTGAPPVNTVVTPAPVYSPTGPAGGGTHVPVPGQPAPTGDVSAACQQLYMFLYTHMFNVCGFVNGMFTNCDVIHQAINVGGLTITQMGVLTGFRTANQGTFQWFPLGQGLMSGRTFKNNLLPGYDIEFTIGGQKHHFRFLAQNPNTASSMAARARAGTKIAYVIDADSNTYKARIIDGQYSLC